MHLNSPLDLFTFSFSRYIGASIAFSRILVSFLELENSIIEVRSII
jgi:hypothetical protein